MIISTVPYTQTENVPPRPDKKYSKAKNWCILADFAQSQEYKLTFIFKANEQSK